MKIMKFVNVKSEVMEVLVNKVSVLSGKENKVRFKIGIKETGDGLASTLAIVNGGAMVEVGFKVSAHKGCEIPEGGAYMSFNLKASDFVQRAGALVALKTDLVIKEEKANIVLATKEGVKVPITKVDDEACEALLPQDYDKVSLKAVAGKDFMEALNAGGYHSLDCADEKLANVTVSFEQGKATVYSVSGASAGKFSAPIQTEFKAAATVKTEEKKVETDNPIDIMKLKEFLFTYGKSLEGDAQREFMVKMGTAVATPESLLAFARECGYGAGVASETPVVEETKVIEPVYAVLSAGNYSIATKLFGGVEKLMLLVTPKNIHISGGCCKATFSLSDFNANIINLFKKFENVGSVQRIVVDRDAVAGALSLMKLGDNKKPVTLTGLKNNVSLEKEGIVGKVGYVAQEGDVEAIEIAFNNYLVGNIISHLKGGNILVKFSGEKSPIFFSNGDLTNEKAGYHLVMPVNIPAKAEKDETEEVETADAEAVVA